jgi:hypothetical protein
VSLWRLASGCSWLLKLPAAVGAIHFNHPTGSLLVGFSLVSQPPVLVPGACRIFSGASDSDLTGVCFRSWDPSRTKPRADSAPTASAVLTPALQLEGPGGVSALAGAPSAGGPARARPAWAAGLEVHASSARSRPNTVHWQGHPTTATRSIAQAVFEGRCGIGRSGLGDNRALASESIAPLGLRTHCRARNGHCQWYDLMFTICIHYINPKPN